MTPAGRFRRELPSAIPPRPYAELLFSGVGERQLRGHRWHRTSRGFYRPAVTRVTPTQRILDALPLVPDGGVLGGWAAGFVHGIDLLDGLDAQTMRQLPILVCLGRDLGRASTGNVVYSRDRLPGADRCENYGVSVASPLRTAFDGARLSDNFAEAVAFLDACAHERLVALDELNDYVRRRTGQGWRGIGRVQHALELADMATRNMWESRLRVCYVREARLPRPMVNRPVFDVWGRLVGIPDLLDPHSGLVVEFDGQDHRRRRGQHRDDNAREERFESLGLIVVRSDSLDLMHHRPELVRRLRTAYVRGCRRDRTKDRWTLAEPEWFIEQTDPTQLLTDAEKAELFG